jgi:hypothetical protein
VQVDPIKPKLKPPGTKRLKRKCDIVLSTLAFKINLGRYNKGCCLVDQCAAPRKQPTTNNRLPLTCPEHAGLLAGAYTRPLFSST